MGTAGSAPSTENLAMSARIDTDVICTGPSVMLACPVANSVDLEHPGTEAVSQAKALNQDHQIQAHLVMKPISHQPHRI